MAYGALVGAGMPSDQAQIVAEHAIEAQLNGKPLYGVEMVPRIVEEYKKSSPSSIMLVKETPVSALLDGGQVPGIVVATKAMEIAIDKAKQSGMGVVGGFNTGGIGILGIYLRQAVKQNLLGFATCNSTSTVVPYGAIGAIFGTNPIGIGVPADPVPIILDMATSAITFAEIRDAIEKGQPVKPGCIVDLTGKTTTDPHMVFETGVLPIDRSYKGYGLCLVAEILAGPLVNAKAGWEAVPGSWGLIMAALDPEILVPFGEFKSDVESLIAETKSARLAEGFTEILIPGELSHRSTKKCLEQGVVEVEQSLVQALEDLQMD